MLFLCFCLVQPVVQWVNKKILAGLWFVEQKLQQFLHFLALVRAAQQDRGTNYYYYYYYWVRYSSNNWTFYSVSLCNRAIRDLWFLWDSGSVSSAAALPQVGLAASLEQYIFISYLCILPVPLRGWQVCPCWGLSAPSRSLWKCPWACGCARRWDSLLSQSCRRTVPAAGCWTKTGCSTTGLICRSCQSSRCSRRNPGPPVYLRRKKKQSVCVSEWRERGEMC